MEFGILGPLEVRRDGDTLALGGVKQRSLLAILLLHANEVVGSERLIDAVWGEQPPGTAATALHGYVSQLRKALEPGGAPYSVLVTHPPGYVLHVERTSFDLPRFESLVADAEAAEPEPAAALLREALALWRGPPLADLAYEAFAQPEIARLEELRLAALEDRIEADLALGRHADLIAELEQLVSTHPLRERLRGQLILALYRAGRQAEALEAYQDTRRTLVDELGIDPGRSLQELERAILRQDPSLELVEKAQPRRRAAATAGRRAAGPFVGRDRELLLLQAGLEDALAGRGRLFLLAGEPGIGKSRLADELASGAKQRGAKVLWGRCWEAGGAPPYWPWVQGIRTYLRETDHERLRAHLGTAAVDIAQMLPELRELFPDLPEPPALEPEAARFRLFDATTAFLERAADTQPLVVVLDDLHAADTPSLLLLEFLAAELAVARILLIGTYRDIELGIDHPLAETLVQLARQASERVHLTGLARPDVSRFIELTTRAEAPEALVAAIHERTDGNPLFVEEVVRLLAAEGALTGDASALARPIVPPSVRDAIGQRLRRLTDECNRVLGLASVLGREFDLDALEQLTGVPRRDLLGLLDEAVAARLVSEAPGTPGRLRFAHALIRDSVYEGLTSARRIEAHREAGEVLEAQHAGDVEPVLAELAYHFVQAGQGGETDKAVDYARRAGDRGAPTARLRGGGQAVRARAHGAGAAPAGGRPGALRAAAGARRRPRQSR